MGVGLAFNMKYNISMKFINKNWRKLVVMFYVLFVPVFMTYADSKDCAGKICNPLGTTSTIPDLIKNIIVPGIMEIGIPIVALAIIYSGFLFVFARGNPEKLTKAKDALLYTLIGAAVLLGSWAIAQMISATVTGLK
jgi:Type IV secretion system pilin